MSRDRSRLTIPDTYGRRMDYKMKIRAIEDHNTLADIRAEIDDIVGFDHDDHNGGAGAAMFKKRQLAELLVALGGPLSEE